jgi:NAD(P)-dependent dehydrogenase (short-subunit alcohol dehydrogenase family)
MTDIGLSGKAVIITGAASGIGRAMANGFVSNGARVFAIDLRQAFSSLTGML